MKFKVQMNSNLSKIVKVYKIKYTRAIKDSKFVLTSFYILKEIIVFIVLLQNT